MSVDTAPGGGRGDVLVPREHGRRVEPLDHGLLDAALADHPLVVAGELAGAGEPERVVAVELLLARFDPAP